MDCPDDQSVPRSRCVHGDAIALNQAGGTDEVLSTPQAATGTDLPVRDRLTRGGYYYFLGSVAGVVGSFTISVILARSLGSAGLGIYALFAVLGVVFVPLLSLSLPSATTKFISELRNKQPRRLADLLSTTLVLLIIAGAFGSGIMFTLGASAAGDLYGEPRLVPMIQILSVFVSANLIALFAGSILQGLEEFDWVNLISVSNLLVNVVLVLLLVPAFGVVGAATAAAAAAVGQAGLSTLMASRSLRQRNLVWSWKYSKEEARTLLTFTAPLNLASILARASVLVQNSLVVLYLGFVDLGLLRVSGVFFSAILFLPKVALAPLLPILSHVASSRTPEREREILTQLVKFSLLLATPIAAALILALPSVIPVVFGGEFLPSIPFATVMIIVAIFTFSNAMLGEHYLLVKGRTRQSLMVTIYSVATGLGTVVLLLPKIGAIALPVASFVSESTLFAILIAWASHRNEVALRPLVPTLTYMSIAVLATLALLQVGTLENSVFLALSAGGVLLLVGLFAIMDKTDRDLLTNALRRGVARLREGAI